MSSSTKLQTEGAGRPNIPKLWCWCTARSTPLASSRFIRERAGHLDDVQDGNSGAPAHGAGRRGAARLVDPIWMASPADLVRGEEHSIPRRGPVTRKVHHSRPADDDLISRQTPAALHGSSGSSTRFAAVCAVSKRCGAASAPDQAGVGQGQYQRRHRSDDPCGGRRQSFRRISGGTSCAVFFACTAAGRRKAGDLSMLKSIEPTGSDGVRRLSLRHRPKPFAQSRQGRGAAGTLDRSRPAKPEPAK